MVVMIINNNMSPNCLYFAWKAKNPVKNFKKNCWKLVISIGKINP